MKKNSQINFYNYLLTIELVMIKWVWFKTNNYKLEEKVMKRTLALLLALLTAIGLLAGCATEPEKTPDPVTPAPGGEDKPGTTPDPVKPAEPFVYYYVRSLEESVLNPHDSNANSNINVNDRVTGVLYMFVPNAEGTGSVLAPCFAESVPTVDATGKVWTIKLRKDAKWADGEAVTADDWMYSWKMTMDPKLLWQTGSAGASNTVDIVNGKAYYSSLSENNGVKWEDVGLKKVDDYTIEVTLSQSYTQEEVMRHFNSRTLALVKEDIYSKCISADGTECDYGTTLDKVAFAGPFMIESWIKASETVFVKNPNWPLADMIHIDKIISRVVTDESTRLELFEKGEATHIDLGTNGLAKYGEDPRVRTYSSQTINTIEANHNHADPVKAQFLNDPEFRQAVFYALDRNAIAKLCNSSVTPFFLSTYGQALADGTLYRDTPEAKALVEKYAPNGGYDPEKANALLDKCLKKYGQTSITMSLMYSETSEKSRMASEYIDNQFDKVFNGKFDITLAAISSSARLTTMRESTKQPVSTWDLCWSSWGLGAEAYYPWKKFTVYTSDKSNRYTNYRNDVLDTLTKVCDTEEVRLDERKTLEYTVQMEESCYQDMTCIPVYGSVSNTLFQDYVKLPMSQYSAGVGFGWIYSEKQ